MTFTDLQGQFHLLQAFQMQLCVAVRQSARFQLIRASRGPSAIAEPLGSEVIDRTHRDKYTDTHTHTADRLHCMPVKAVGNEEL